MNAKEQYKLFKEVSVTDPKYCKPVRVPGREPFTNIDTYYLIERATERFGLLGSGWGLRNERWEHVTLLDETVLTLQAEFFHPFGAFPVANAIRFAYVTAKGKKMVDADAYKKLTTNTLAKALSYIGFGTDVYLGKFEDESYINDAFMEFATLTPQQVAELKKALGYYGVSEKAVLEHFIVRRLADLAASEYEKAMALVKNLSKRR